MESLNGLVKCPITSIEILDRLWDLGVVRLVKKKVLPPSVRRKSIFFEYIFRRPSGPAMFQSCKPYHNVAGPGNMKERV